MAQKLALLGLGDVIQTRTLLIPVDNQRAVSWSVQLYAGSLGKPGRADQNRTHASYRKPVRGAAEAAEAGCAWAGHEPCVTGCPETL